MGKRRVINCLSDKRGQNISFSLCNKNRRGQFFLIAAVVIIAVIVSIVTITNYTQKKDVVRLYDLGEELGIESQQVLDYGTYSELNEEEMTDLIENFIDNYVSYIGTDKNIYFIFGNKYKINIVGYQEITESVQVCFDVEPEESRGTSKGASRPSQIVQEGECKYYLNVGETESFIKGTEEDRKVIHKVKVIIGDVDYEFPLKYGENFYFVIWQEIGGEKHVVTSPAE